jgi:hypothetical protein
MSASYDFGDTSCPVCPFLIISHLLKGYSGSNFSVVSSRTDKVRFKKGGHHGKTI